MTPPNTLASVWTRVHRGVPDACWPYLGTIASNGYGVISVAGRQHKAHRLAYELAIGPIPDGLVLDHLCRNRECCNPEHLQPVTNGENVRRGEGVAARNGRKHRCINGHAFTPENTEQRRTGRRCRTCRRAEWRRWNTNKTN